jgi:transcriptional regulator with XRE-family HTH domain
MTGDDAFGRALRTHRQGKGMSLRQLASLVHCSHAHIADLESGRRRPGESLAEQLEHVLEAQGIFTLLLPSTAGNGSSSISLRSHKFITAYVGGDCIPELLQKTQARTVDGFLSGHWSMPLNHTSGIGELHIWEHGAVVCHLVEEGTWSSISEFAEWRYRTYERDLTWISSELHELAGTEAGSSYVLSAYWLDKSSIPADRLHSALKLICMPRTLFRPECQDRSTEEHLLQDGFDHEDLKCFGVADMSIAYASWSGIAYHSLDPTNGLAEADLIRFELAAQSLWVFCSAVSTQIEEGRDPKIPPSHDWRWLRGARSRLTMSRSQETGHHRSMREAILSTSGLPTMLDETIAVLREIAE